MELLRTKDICKKDSSTESFPSEGIRQYIVSWTSEDVICVVASLPLNIEIEPDATYLSELPGRENLDSCHTHTTRLGTSRRRSVGRFWGRLAWLVSIASRQVADQSVNTWSWWIAFTHDRYGSPGAWTRVQQSRGSASQALTESPDSVIYISWVISFTRLAKVRGPITSCARLDPFFSVPKQARYISDTIITPNKSESTCIMSISNGKSSNTSHEGHTALVFGASGISGWAVMQNLLSYPSPDTFRRIVGLTNRPMSKADGNFAEDDKRIELYSGFDLRQELGGVKTQLTNTVPRLQELTHVYYCGK